MTRAHLTLALFALAVDAVACGRSVVQSLPPVDSAVLGPAVPVTAGRWKPFVVPGESSAYDVQFRGMSVGRLRVSVAEPFIVDEGSAIVSRTEVDGTGFVAMVKEVSGQLETTLNLSTGMPIRSVSSWSTKRDGRRKTGHRVREHRDVHDFHSAVALVRAWDPAAGERIRLRVDIGGRFSMVLGPVAREYNRRYKAAVLRIQGTAHIDADRPFVLVITDDARRLLLSIEMSTQWGRVSINLTDYDGPGSDGDVRLRELSPI